MPGYMKRGNGVNNMTIREIYDWAKEHDCLDITIAKHSNTDIMDIRDIVHLKEVLPDLYNEDYDRVVLD